MTLSGSPPGQDELRAPHALSPFGLRGYLAQNLGSTPVTLLRGSVSPVEKAFCAKLPSGCILGRRRGKLSKAEGLPQQPLLGKHRPLFPFPICFQRVHSPAVAGHLSVTKGHCEKLMSPTLPSRPQPCSRRPFCGQFPVNLPRCVLDTCEEMHSEHSFVRLNLCCPFPS